MKFSKLPQWQRLSILLTLMLLVTFMFGRQYVTKELSKKREQIVQLESDLQTFRAENESLRTANAVSVQEATILQQANNLLRDSERQRQDEIATLKADLAFYRRLGGADGAQAGLAIHQVELRPTDSPQVFKLVFTLTQNIRWAASISGNVNVSIEGIQNGKAARLEESKLLAENTDSLKFEFKYFQQLERLINLPEGFDPTYLTLKLNPTGSSKKVEQTLDWQDLFGESTIKTASD